MKTIIEKSYKCEHCGQVFDKEEEALKHENACDIVLCTWLMIRFYKTGLNVKWEVFDVPSMCSSHKLNQMEYLVKFEGIEKNVKEMYCCVNVWIAEKDVKEYTEKLREYVSKVLHNHNIYVYDSQYVDLDNKIQEYLTERSKE